MIHRPCIRFWKSISFSEFFVVSWAHRFANFKSLTNVTISTASYLSGRWRSSRMRPDEMNADSEDTMETSSLRTSWAKRAKIGNEFWCSFHHLSTSSYVTVILTQWEFRYFCSFECWEVGLDELWDDCNDWRVSGIRIHEKQVRLPRFCFAYGIWKFPKDLSDPLALVFIPPWLCVYV